MLLSKNMSTNIKKKIEQVYFIPALHLFITKKSVLSASSNSSLMSKLQVSKVRDMYVFWIGWDIFVESLQIQTVVTSQIFWNPLEPIFFSQRDRTIVRTRAV